MTLATRALTVTYGAFTLDASNGCELDANPVRYVLRETHLEGEFYVEFRVYLATPSGVDATDDQAFATLVNAIELALRSPRKKLVVKLGTRTINGNGSGWDPATAVKTALLVTPELTKLGGEEDTGRTRKYGFRVRCVIPFDLSGANYRRASSTQVFTGINGRRVAQITGEWTGGPNLTALQAYQDSSTDTWFAGQLPAAVASGAWIKDRDEPVYDDENAILSVTRTYLEVVNGLREFTVNVDYAPSQARTVTISGFYTYTAGATAKQNHDDGSTGVTSLVSNVLAAISLTAANAELKARRSEGYDTTGQRYFFSRTIAEQVYPQGPAGMDDTGVVDFRLDVQLETPWTPASVAPSARVERLKTGRATYTAIFDKDVSTELQALWESTYRAHCTNALAEKLGAGNALIMNEVVGLGLDRNQLQATLDVIVRGGNVIALDIREKVKRTSVLNPAPMGDGQPHSYHPYKKPPEKILSRVAVIVFVRGGAAPRVFVPGEKVSGFDLVNTRRTYKADLDAQERGDVPSGSGWMCLEGDDDINPRSQGENDELELATFVQTETWLYFSAMAQPPAPRTATGGGGAVRTATRSR